LGRRFLEAAGNIPHGLIFELALLSGMRPEEFLALQWPDLDFERGTAKVNRALVRHNNAWTFEQAESRLKLGSLWQAHDLVFCSEWGTPHSIPNLTYRYFRPILEKTSCRVSDCMI
jgi:hypothetical protein